MKEYHKIVTVWERDPATNFKTLIEGKWAEPEFEYLKDCPWVCTEKVDGTNIRVMWDGEKVSFGGKTDAAQLYVPLFEKLQGYFYAGAMARIFDGPVCLYGEGYGAKIQKGGGNYISESVDFTLFDVLVGDNWLERDNVVDIANRLEVTVVPILRTCPLLEAIEMTRKGFQSSWGDFRAEGLVMRPQVELRSRRGSRVITKIKCTDFR
jgi:hypothetical protein